MSALVATTLATLTYLFVLSFVEAGRIPLGLDDLRTALAVLLVASSLTIPGALLLAAVRLDLAIVAVGALAGATMLGASGLSTNGAAEAATLGAFYGSIRALVFVVMQRRMGARQRQGHVRNGWKADTSKRSMFLTVPETEPLSSVG
jgi:hypothetical protein